MAAVFGSTGAGVLAGKLSVKGADGDSQIGQASQGLFDFDADIVRRWILAAINDFSEEEGVVQFELDGGASSHGAIEFQSETTAGDVLDAGAELNIGLPKEGDPDGLVGSKARVAPFLHIEPIGGNAQKV